MFLIESDEVLTEHQLRNQEHAFTSRLRAGIHASHAGKILYVWDASRLIHSSSTVEEPHGYD